MSPARKNEIEILVATNQGAPSSLFTHGAVDLIDPENAGETHFIISVDNGRTPGFFESSNLKYADFISGGEDFTIMVRLTGGTRFKNCSYIFGVHQQGQ